MVCSLVLNIFWLHTFFIKQHFFFNSASVLLNFLKNWASSVGQVLLNTYRHHHVETPLIFTIFVSMCRRTPIYVICMWSFSIFILNMINCIISWIQTHLFFRLFLGICSIIFGWQRVWRMWIILKYQKFSLRMLLSICLIFCQFQPGVAYKSVAYKKRV